MNKVNYIFICVLLILGFLSCNKTEKVSLSEEKEKILKLHKAQRDYHFNKDSIAFVNQLSDNFISINKGKITTPTKQETQSRYHRYFSSVEFIKWDDVTEPIIKFSNDGTIAYTIVDKIVSVKYLNENDSLVVDKTHFAWTAIYKKYDNEWKIDSVTSTNQ